MEQAMEQMRVEITRLNNEMNSMKVAVRTEFDTLHQLFTQATEQQQQSRPQQRRLNHREAERHLPQAFGGARQNYADFAFRLENYAAVLSTDGEGGNLLKEVANASKYDAELIDRLDLEYWDVKTISAAVAAALVSCTQGEVAVLVRRVLGADLGNGLRCWSAITQWFRPRSVVEEASSMARIIAPKRAKTVSELQTLIMNWELALAEHQAKFPEQISDSVKTAALRGMIPKDMVDRFLDGPFDYEGLRARVSSYVGEKMAVAENSDPKPMDIGEVDAQSDDEDEIGAVQRPPRRQGQPDRQRSTRDRPPPTTKDRRVRSMDVDATGDKRGSPPATTPVTGSVKKPRKTLICYKCGGKGHPAKICPSEEGAKDLDEVDTDQRHEDDGDDLCGIDWGDEDAAEVNGVDSEGADHTRQCVLAYVDSGAVDNVLPKNICPHVPLMKTARSRSGIGFKGANGAHIHHYGQKHIHVKTDLGKSMVTKWEVADVRKPLISAARLLEKGHKLIIDSDPRIQCKGGGNIPLKKVGSLFAVQLWVSAPSSGGIRQG